ncbi:peroxiredoxin family protein [Mucilaginibacter lacusdianchii]|uniref:peroxiredoxin family protein n=1 Tax=Mucilaginibacter lacusdianchii TaxID=2684211 RepID=UPI00131B1542|nr:TlpA disulfide reductase family protein [Mucilaginibacter sp. JXJ CY 39]
MSTLKPVFISVILCLIFTTGYSQPHYKSTYSLKGYINLTIDISALKDTVGVFDIRIGGGTQHLKRKNNQLFVKYYMDEPRRAHLMFYPRDTIKKYPNKSLNYIPARFNDYFEFLAHPGIVNIVAKGNIHSSQIINASQPQKDYTALIQKQQNFEKSFAQENNALIQQIKVVRNKKTKDSLLAICYKTGNLAYQKYNNDVVLNYIKRNPDSPTALQQLEEYSYSNFVKFDALASLYKNFTDRIKALPTAKRIYNQIDNHQFFENNLVGKAAPDFTLKDVSGKDVSLHDFKGHVTLLEFWASWCGPCRENNPDLVKIYQKYKAKDFKIIAVSLDFKKEPWLEAIVKDRLTWTHVSEFKGFDGKVSNQYHVFGIPGNYLIDANGKVLAKDLEEKQLDEHLSKLYH